jgi:hypothetical protein
MRSLISAASVIVLVSALIASTANANAPGGQGAHAVKLQQPQGPNALPHHRPPHPAPGPTPPQKKGPSK